MKVTVVMSVHNAADVVQTAVESIIKQTYENWDFLIIDDASTDGSLAKLRAIAERETRITIVPNASNLGLAASLNLALKHAKGDLIARMDADDVSLPERLEHQVRFMEAHPEVAVLGTGAELVDEQGRPLGTAFRPERHEALTAKIYKETPFIHPSTMLRRNFLEALNGYDERLRRAQDKDLWLRGYRRFRFHNLQEALIRYQVRRAQSINAIIAGTWVLGRAAYREGRLLTHGWYSLRFLTATLLTKAGIWHTRLY